MAVGANASRAEPRGRTKKGRVRKPSPAVAPEEMHRFYRNMLTIRRFEEKAGQLYGMGLIGGFCHLYIGQEAVVVGMQAAIEEGDTVITSYRDHGHMIAVGMDPRGVMAELTGRANGYSKGKGGSMHMFSREKNFYGGHGIVAAQVPIGTGIAFAHRYNDKGRVCLTYLGDGAINQGQVAESFNMAALWHLPVVYVIENNKYGMGTSVERASANPDLHVRGQAYGIPGKQVDGMDVLAVNAAGEEAVAYCRAGKGPYILEMLTYRYRGHSMSDSNAYRSKTEERMWSERDPIILLRDRLIKAGEMSKDDYKAMDTEVLDQIENDVIAFAESSPEPRVDELEKYVLADNDPWVYGGGR
jgi:pyruvate dehydrogenase E1 component alpha subunit